VPLGDASYEIVLGTDLLPALAALLERPCPAAHYAVVTDSTVAPLYGERVRDALAVAAPCSLHVFPAGEWNKSRETWAAVIDGMLAARVGRDGAVVAVGGGVVGDVAGFVAATYLRGIPYVQVPTTLLAMIDSSIGGKTGVDTPAGKNLIGAFHQPRAVFADLDTIATLPPVHRIAGMAEALKHGIIADAAYFDRLLSARPSILEAQREVLLDAVRRSVEIKAEVVAHDERERGRRAILNFGHTVGHALETVAGYELIHGEAVATGMVVESRLGVLLGLTDPAVEQAVRAALEAYGFPIELPAGASAARLLEVMQADKKVRDGTVRFALPARAGEMARANDGRWTVAAAPEMILNALAHFG
jgi:3-dehydroquinate synthase